MFSVLYVLNACGDDLKSQFIWDVNFKHAPLEKSSEFKTFIDYKLKFYVLHFSVWGDLGLTATHPYGQELGLWHLLVTFSFL